MRSIRRVLAKYPKEAEIIGRILVGYGELEYLVCRCVGFSVGNLNTAARVMFRLRSEDMRLQVADAIMRPNLTDMGFKDQYGEALGAMRFSKSIRNQYSHAHWMDGREKLLFTDLSKAASTAIGTPTVGFNEVDVTLLTDQENYLEYAGSWFFYFGQEQSVKAGQLANHTFPIPKIIDKPLLRVPQETMSLHFQARLNKLPQTEAQQEDPAE